MDNEIRDEGALGEKDIEALFDRVAEHFKDADDDTKGMFAMLVDTTLKYRNTLMHSSGHALTVGETSAALNAFMEVLRTRGVPEGLDKRVHDLVMLWLEEIKTKIHH